MLNTSTRVQLERSIELLRRERDQLQGLISALETAVRSDMGRPQEERRSVRRSRKASSNARTSTAIAAILRPSADPISAAEIVKLLRAQDRNDSYQRVYGALRKSPLFSKVGARWTVCALAGLFDNRT